MPRFRPEYSAIAALALMAGCAIDEGQPWGLVEIAVSARFAPAPERLDDQGRLKTANDYRVEIEQISVVGQEARLVLTSEGAATFDPANPPAGYSLCHNGHCHADSGALVDYAEIAAELGTSGGGPSIAVTLEGQTVLTNTPTALPVAGCDGGCLAPRGRSDTAVVVLSSLRVVGTAYDARTGDDARIGEEGVPFDLTTPAAITMVGRLPEPEEFGPPNRNDILVDIDLLLSDRVLDAVEFSTLAGDTDSDGALLVANASNSTVNVDILH